MALRRTLLLRVSTVQIPRAPLVPSPGCQLLLLLCCLFSMLFLFSTPPPGTSFLYLYPSTETHKALPAFLTLPCLIHEIILMVEWMHIP